MEVGTREAIRRICEIHLIGKVEANRALLAGLAGPGRKVGRAVLYDEDALAGLLARPRCSDDVLDAVRPLLVRLGRDRRVNVGDSWTEQAEVVRRSWYVPFFPGLMLDRWGCLGDGRFPLVATVASWVVFGAEVTGHRFDEGDWRRTQNRRTPPRTFEVEPPGDWFDAIKGTWLPLEHGPTVTIWGMPTCSALREVDWLSADAFEQKEQIEYEMWLRSAPGLREAAQVGLTTAAAILRAWGHATAIENQTHPNRAGQRQADQEQATPKQATPKQATPKQATPPRPDAGRGGVA